MLLFSEQREREVRDNFAHDTEMSAGNKEKAEDGGLENLDETEDPGGDRKEEKPQLEVEDEKPDKGKNEESKDVTEPPGPMGSEKENAEENSWTPKRAAENPTRQKSMCIKKRILSQKSKMTNPRMLWTLNHKR